MALAAHLHSHDEDFRRRIGRLLRPGPAPITGIDDVREGIVSREAAEREYGVVLDAAASAVDEAATVKRRNEMRAKG